jgi:hypothetical protein
VRLPFDIDGQSVEEATEVHGQGIVGGELGSCAETIRGSCWAALAETSRREAGRGIEVRGLRPEEALVALRQVRHGLSWLRVFFLRQKGTLEKVFEWGLWGATPQVIITTDASLWGFGATPHWEGVLVAALTEELQEDDLARFNLQKGDGRGQSLWEAMAELIAARTWKDWWLGQPWSLVSVGTAQRHWGSWGS